MKAGNRDFPSKAQGAARDCRVFFFCGQDEAGASAAAERICSLLPEAGERVEFTGAELKKDPVRLADEARSTSLFGDKRHIYVRASGDDSHDAVKNLLDVIDANEGEACPVLIVATSATDKSRTAKLLEPRRDALMAMFYPPDLRDIIGQVRDMGPPAGLRLDGEMSERIALATGLDVRLAQSEIAKLALYVDADTQAPKTPTMDDIDAVGASTEDDGMMPVINAVLNGEAEKLQSELRRMREVPINAVGLLLMLERRAAQLAALSAKLGPKGDVSALLEAESRARRVFWGEKKDLERQLRFWKGRRLERLVERLVATHRAMMANSQAGELFLAQELAEIARVVAARR